MKNAPETFHIVIANAEKNISLHLQEAGLCVPQKPAIRIPVSDSSGNCDSQAGMSGLAVQAADGRGVELQISVLNTHSEQGAEPGVPPSGQNPRPSTLGQSCHSSEIQVRYL
jgi:hypothetical protein